SSASDPAQAPRAWDYPDKPPPRGRAESPLSPPPASQWPPKAPPPRLFARRANAPSRPTPPRSLVLLYLLLSCPPHHLRTPDAAGLPNPLLCNIVSRSLAPPL